MSDAPFAVRAYRPADEAGVLTLLNLSLGDGRPFQRNSDFFRWKHFDNPFGVSLLMVADGPSILGLRAFMRWRFRLDDRAFQAVRAVDTATHPQYRRHGIFSTLTRDTVEQARAGGVDLIFNTPNQHSLPGYLKLGWSYVGRPHVLIRVLHPLRLWRGPSPGGEAEEDWTMAAGAGQPVAALLADEPLVGRLLAANDRLCTGRLRTDRSPHFLRWRYLAVPSLTYHAAWHHSGKAAVIFRASRRHGRREVMLCEVLLADGATRALGDLVRALAAEAGADYLIAHAPWGSPHWWALVRARFVPLPRLGPHFTVRPLKPATAAVGPAQMRRWYLSLGDLEVF